MRIVLIMFCKKRKSNRDIVLLKTINDFAKNSPNLTARGAKEGNIKR